MVRLYAGYQRKVMSIPRLSLRRFIHTVKQAHRHFCCLSHAGKKTYALLPDVCK